MNSVRATAEVIKFTSLTVGEQAFLRRAGMRPGPKAKVSVAYLNHPDELFGPGSPNGVVHQQGCQTGTVLMSTTISHAIDQATGEYVVPLRPGSYAAHQRDVEHRTYVTRCTCRNRKHIWRPGKRGTIEFPSAATFLHQALALREALEHGWMEMYFPEFGSHGTRRAVRASKKWLLFRFVPRPLTLLKALEYGEVEDLGWARVEADKAFEAGRTADGERLAKYLYQEATQ